MQCLTPTEITECADKSKQLSDLILTEAELLTSTLNNDQQLIISLTACIGTSVKLMTAMGMPEFTIIETIQGLVLRTLADDPHTEKQFIDIHGHDLSTP